MEETLIETLGRRDRGRSPDRPPSPSSTSTPCVFLDELTDLYLSFLKFTSIINMRLSSVLLLPVLSFLSFTSAQTLSASSTSFSSVAARSGSSFAPTASPSASSSRNSTSTSSSLPPLPSGSLLPNGTFIYPNGTSNATATNLTAPLAVPYDIKLDGAYGVAGAILILTGIPIATLGSKNRW